MAKGQTTKPLTEKEKAAKKEAAEKEKAANFRRLFEKRVTVACDKIAIVGNCSGAGYIYTKEQASQGIQAMLNKVKVVADRFNKKTKEAAVGFKLQEPEQGS